MERVVAPIKIKGSGNVIFKVLCCPFCQSVADELGDPQGPDKNGWTLIPCPECGNNFFLLTGKKMTYER